MEINAVTEQIESWIRSFVEVPHPALGGWPPCPYARAARLKQSFQVLIGVDPYFDLKNRARWGLGSKEVWIYVYDPDQWKLEQFSASVHSANQQYLLPVDMIALEDHPTDPEIVNGVSMNQGTYALALVQSLSELNSKTKIIADKGFYHDWPESYLTTLFQHRQDPRQ